MDTISGAALARELGTSVPRVSRAIDRLGLDVKQPNGRFALTDPQAEAVRRALGAAPPIVGLSRSEVRALAAMRSAPFGLVSARAVSKRSGLSPTSATKALCSLLEKGLATHRRETIAAGRARSVAVWRANHADPRWTELDPLLAMVQPPDRSHRVQASRRVPSHLLHLFWNTDDSQLNPNVAGPYIARRLLRTMDLQGLAWGSRVLSANDWLEGSRARGLDPGIRQLARNMARVMR